MAATIIFLVNACHQEGVNPELQIEEPTKDDH